MDDKIVISDLLNVIHFAIIKHYGVNDIILKELTDIDEKINSGALIDLNVKGLPMWESIKSTLK